MVDRRKRGDLIQYFKINNGFDKVIWHNPPITIENSITRGHNQKMIREKLHKNREGQIGKTNARHYFFNNRVVENWNKLPQEVIDSRTVNQFKNRLDNYAIKNQNKFY